MYQKNLKSNFPPDLAALCQSIARQAAGCPASSSTPFVPEAAIVNYYPLGASMGGHLDDAEHTMEQPIVSLSLGCSAIFLIGGRDRRTRPVPVLLRSGDAVVMSGESRYCYHGVPCILPVNFTPLTSVDGADGEDEGNQDGPCPADFARSVSSVADLYGLCTEGDAAARRVVDFLCEARININVRQVRVNPALEHVWVEKAGTGGQKVAPTAAANGTD